MNIIIIIIIQYFAAEAAPPPTFLYSIIDNINTIKFVIDAKSVTQNDDPNELNFDGIGDAINNIHDINTNKNDNDNKPIHICLIAVYCIVICVILCKDII